MARPLDIGFDAVHPAFGLPIVANLATAKPTIKTSPIANGPTQLLT
jgi:hypothetical protein